MSKSSSLHLPRHFATVSPIQYAEREHALSQTSESLRSLTQYYLSSKGLEKQQLNIPP